MQTLNQLWRKKLIYIRRRFLQRRLLLCVSGALFFSMMVLLSGNKQGVLEEDSMTQKENMHEEAMLPSNETELIAIKREMASIRAKLAAVKTQIDSPDNFMRDIEPVTISPTERFDLRQCSDSDKLFRGTFRQNLRKIQNLQFPEAEKWIKQLGLDKPRSREIASFPVFVTAATSNYFDISQGVIKSVHELLMPKYPNLKFIYYGLDLLEDQKRRLKQYCRCEFRELPLDKLPTHIRRWKIYAFKPIIVATLFQEFGHVWWVDSSIRFITNKLEGPLEYIKQTGSIFYTYSKDLSTAMHTRIGTFNYFKEHPCPYGEFGELESGNVAFYENEVTRVIVRHWLSCALIENCQAPPGHQLSCETRTTQVGQCHRYDQSVLSIMMRRLYHEQNDYPLTETPWRIIKVMRGQKVKYLPP